MPRACQCHHRLKMPGSSSPATTAYPAWSPDLSRWTSFNAFTCWCHRSRDRSPGLRSPTAAGCVRRAISGLWSLWIRCSKPALPGGGVWARLPASGLRFRKAYQRFDAELAFDFDPGPTLEPKGCICGEVLRAVKTPRDCQLFGKVCTPASPVGPCMVSSEGSCAAYYLYGAVE